METLSLTQQPKKRIMGLSTLQLNIIVFFSLFAVSGIIFTIIYFTVIKPEKDKKNNENDNNTDNDTNKNNSTNNKNSNNHTDTHNISNNKPNIIKKPENNNLTPNTKTNKVGRQAQVFSTNSNIWTYDEAEAVCKSQGAELATYEQLVEAAKNGANWCNLGWVDSNDTTYNMHQSSNRFAHFPVQKSVFNKMKTHKNRNLRNKCGQVWNDKFDDKEYAIQGGAYNKNSQLAVNCYGEKRDPLRDEKILLQPSSTDDLEMRQKLEAINRKLGNKELRLSPWVDNGPEGVSKWSK